ncbi:MAG: rhomboid family intramembrane serine protease [Candidatus Bathyarchaeota archaeon]|nr:rhomboid family intramembrane serine protease [Candidatus Bathyarchaeota archaeon]
MKSSQQYHITYVLMAINIAVYIYTSIAGGDALHTSFDMIVQYGQVNGLVLGYGYYHQLFTSMFVHITIVHLAGNMLFLLIFGLRAEELFTLPEYLSIYFLGGLAGNLLSLAFMPPWIPSAGASGAIFAMFGACTIYIRRTVGQSIVGALIFAFFLLMISSGPEVNNLAHLGGLVAGLLIGYVLALRQKPEATYTYNYSYTTPF